MRGTRTTNRIEEQAALYALGMLGRQEARAFELEVAAGNQEAVASLEIFNPLVPYLAFSAPEVSPSTSVRDNLLGRITGEFEVKR